MIAFDGIGAKSDIFSIYEASICNQIRTGVCLKDIIDNI